jgi:hypothetical protein
MGALSHINQYFWTYKWLLLLGIIFTLLSNFFFTFHVGHELAMSAARNEAYGPARVTKLGKQVGRLKRGTGASAVPWQA